LFVVGRMLYRMLRRSKRLGASASRGRRIYASRLASASAISMYSLRSFSVTGPGTPLPSTCSSMRTTGSTKDETLVAKASRGS